jgi:hypothetical protein
MFQETKQYYRRYDVGTVGASYAYGRLGSPSGHPVNGKNFVDTTGSVVQVDAVDGTPFDPVGVGDIIVFFSPRPDGKIERTVAVKTSGIEIDVDAVVDLSSPAGGFAFMFWPFRTGTGVDNGWHHVAAWSAITVHARVETLNSTSIDLIIEGSGGDLSGPTVLETPTNITAVGTVAINVEKVAPFMRVGLKANTPAAGDSVNVWAVGEMLQAK